MPKFEAIGPGLHQLQWPIDSGRAVAVLPAKTIRYRRQRRRVVADWRRAKETAAATSAACLHWRCWHGYRARIYR